ncbi:hypothetical protein niasHS_010500 [Heterodera schachtii]|uniref:Uncharacterized protein n=1 Tax=Heterodera schachtii TaxID=97005 RepID=A0ABD2J6A3_HETSC
MWFEDRSLSNMKVSSLIVEEWRDIWSAKSEFMFAAFAYLFATTNFLNLPRLILDNGGPAFLVAYGAALVLVVFPIVALEICLGQLTGRGPVQAFYNICPVFKGVGISQILFSLFVLATMTHFLARLIIFIYALFWTLTDDRPGLPWLHCKNFPEIQFGPCRESMSVISQNGTSAIVGTVQRLATFHEESAMSKFQNLLDHKSDSVADVGNFNWHFLVAQCLIWILVFCAICFGVRWLGKVIVFSFIVPLALLLALCGRAMFASGAVEIFQEFFVDSLDWHKLKDYLVWKTAVEQAILASGVGFGALITVGSYNKRSNNLVKDSFVLVFTHALISVLQVATVVALVGHVSAKNGLSPDQLIDQGKNQFYQLLVFLGFLPHAKILSGLFLFLCAFVLLNVFYLLALSILATLEDALGEKWSRCCPRFSLALFLCLFCASSSLFFATQAGAFGYELVSGFLNYVTVLAILAFELFAVGWVYCAHSLAMDLRTMLSSVFWWCVGYLLLSLSYGLCFVPIAISVLNVLGYSFAKYSPQLRSWEWSEWCGIAIALFPLLPIPFCALLAIFRACARGGPRSLCRRFCLAFRSPMRYELMKGSVSSGGVHHRVTSHHGLPRSSRFSAASSAPTGGYVLLPQAPLAQPESDDVVAPGSAKAGARSRHTNETASSTLRADSPGSN